MDIKKCCSCKEDLSLDCFQKDRRASDGLQHRCKKCTSRASKECRAKRGHLWLEKTNPWGKRPENRDRVNAATRAREARRPIEVKRKERYRWTLSFKYGLTPGLKQALIDAQDGVCSICFTPISITCATDHDHKKDCVRGMLCKPCNSALGLFKDDPVVLRRAADYLEQSETITDKPTTEDFIVANKILEDVLNGRQSEKSQSLQEPSQTP